MTADRARRSVIYNRRVIRGLDRFAFAVIGSLITAAIALWSSDDHGPSLVLLAVVPVMWFGCAFGVYMHKVQLDAAERASSEHVEHWPPPKANGLSS